MSKHDMERSIRVLVVDDDLDVCQYLERFLTARNYEVKYTNDPEQTIPLLKDELYQILILDVVMPGVNGLELLKQVRKIDKDICVIMLSGYPTFDRAVEAFRQQIFDFLTKPFETEELVAVLDRAIQKYGFRSDLSQKAVEKIASEVRRLRAEQKLSLRQLASRTGLSPSLIYQIEHAHTAPSLATISRLASALQAPLEQLFKGL
jgi:DNA-binding NtrC family response regulator